MPGADEPDSYTRSLSLYVFDGTDVSDSCQITVNVVLKNDNPPELDLGLYLHYQYTYYLNTYRIYNYYLSNIGQDTLNYTEESPAILFLSDVSLSDKDLNFPLDRVDISVTPTCEDCVFVSASSLPHNFTYANNIWSVWNAGSAYAFQQVLREIWISFDTPELSQTAFTFEISVFDSADTPVTNCTTVFGSFIVTETFQFYFIHVNDIAPVLDLNGNSPGNSFATVFIEESDPIEIVSSQLTITEGDLPQRIHYNYKIDISVS